MSAVTDVQNEPGLLVPDDREVNWFREGKTYSVAFGTYPVLCAPHRKMSRRIARKWNDALRELQRAAWVDTDALLAALQEYFAAATVQGQGFVPPINEDFGAPNVPLNRVLIPG
jgi:hypothetical protein